MKASILVFLLCIVAVGSVVAQEKLASFSPRSTTADAGFNVGYANQIAAPAIDQPIIDRFVSLDSSNGDRSSRYSASLDLENEDSDWSFEVSITIEF